MISSGVPPREEYLASLAPGSCLALNAAPSPAKHSTGNAPSIVLAAGEGKGGEAEWVEWGAGTRGQGAEYHTYNNRIESNQREPTGDDPNRTRVALHLHSVELNRDDDYGATTTTVVAVGQSGLVDHGPRLLLAAVLLIMDPVSDPKPFQALVDIAVVKGGGRLVVVVGVAVGVVRWRGIDEGKVLDGHSANGGGEWGSGKKSSTGSQTECEFHFTIPVAAPPAHSVHTISWKISWPQYRSPAAE